MLFTTDHKTKFGNLTLISDREVLIAAGFGGVKNLVKRLNKVDQQKSLKVVKSIPTISNLILDYFDGEFSAINSIKIRQSGAKFSQNAWKAMRKIPAGKTISYSELAKWAGSPDAVRAAGTACANNLIAPIVPCHRIIKSNGEIGNYGYGVKVKKLLLTHEGAL
jgi:methylated-DNA-[protein]-cysteine S-methyltransferase